MLFPRYGLDAQSQALGPETFPTFRGCLLSISADQTGKNLTADNYVVPWDGEVFDTDSFHDNVTNNTRITIPSAVNGKYGIVCCTLWINLLTLSNFSSVKIQKNATNQTAIPVTGSFTNQDTQMGHNLVSLPFLLTTNDFYTVNPFTPSDTSVTIQAAQSSFSLMVLP